MLSVSPHAPHADRRDHRGDVGALVEAQDVRVDLARLADQAEVEDALDVGVGIALGPTQPLRPDQVAVLAGQADREAAGVIDRRDDLLVDRAGQHHLDDVDGLLVGDAQAVDELALDLQPIEHAADLRPAAVHDDRIDADLAQQHDVAGEQAGQLLVRPSRGRRT